MKIDLRDWKEFELKKLFKIRRLVKVSSEDGGYVKDHEIISDDGSYPYIAAVSVLNGIKGYTNIKPNNKGNCITFSTTTDSATTVFYQPVDFVGRQQMVGLYGIKDNEMSIKKAMFLIPIIKRNLAHFNYDNKLTYEDVESLKILLPAKYNEEKKKYEPDWEFIEKYIEELERENKNKSEVLESVSNLNSEEHTKKKYEKMNISKWREFEIGDIFETEGNKRVPTGSYVKKETLYLNPGETPRITVKGTDNGIDGYYSELIEDPGYRIYENFISVTFLGDCFYHKGKASLDMKVHCLKPLGVILNEYLGLFLTTTIKKELSIFNYGDQINSEDLKNIKIKLPSKEDKPDWEHMEAYVRDLQEINRNKLELLESGIYLDADKSGGGGYNRLDITDWHEFRLPQIFSEIKRGTRLKSGDRTLGKTLLITAGEVNNGLSCYIEKNDTLFTGRCLTIDMFGNTFYRDYDFYADDNIIVFKNDKINESQMLFLASVISKVTKIYSYKEQFRLNSVNKAKILLPAIYNEEKDEYEPDWEYMENYIEERKRVIEEKLRSLEYE